MHMHTDEAALMNVKILSTGRFLPARQINNGELEEQLGLQAGTIVKRNGVKFRYKADPLAGETTSQMAAWAAEDALRNAGLDKNQLDLIIFASAAAEQAVPDTAPLIQEKLGLGSSGIACFSVHSTCLSFLTALDIASSFIAAERYQTILIVCCERSFTSINEADPSTYTLFGDAAAAAILGPTPQEESSQFLQAHFSTFGEAANLTELKGCGTRQHPNDASTRFEDNTFQMKGRELLRYTLKNAPPVLDKIWPNFIQNLSDFALIIPHQPSQVGMVAMSRYLPPEKTIQTLAKYGNCVSVSLPLSLDEAIRSGQLHRGMQTLIFGTGAGLTVAGIVLVF